MYKIGYIDDYPTQYNNYRKKIQRRFPDVDLVLFDNCKTKEEFLERIYEEQADVLLIDYKMASTYGFNGSTLINYINDQMRDLECFILTGVDQDKVDDGLVAERNRYSKDIFDTEGDDEEKISRFYNFIDVLIQSADVFRNRREQKKEEYLRLYEKRKQGELSLKEEEEYLRLYKVLSSYGMIESLPEEVLTGEFDIDNEVYFADICWNELMKSIKGNRVTYKEISKFPAVKRDLALLIDKKVQFAEIEKIAYETDKKLLKSVELFDVYEGKNLEAGKKSYAVSFMLQDENATLNDKQIDKFMQKLITNLQNKLDAKLR